MEVFDMVRNSATSTDDDYGHGTWVASVAGAYANNSAGGAGEAFGATIMPVKINWPGQDSAYASDIADGIIWAADHGAQVVNLSFSKNSEPDGIIEDAAAYLESKGGVMFQCAGNFNVSLTYPDVPSIITVSATDQNDQKASFSNYGAPIDLAAPGVNIVVSARDGQTYRLSGTSFSTPLSAGVAALMLARNPSLTPSDLKSLLLSNADDLGAVGKDPLYGRARLNARRMVQNTQGMPVSDITS